MTFFRIFRLLQYKEFSSGRVILFFELEVKSSGFHFQKYKKSFLLRKYKNFFNLTSRKFHFWKYKELFSGLVFFQFFQTWAGKWPRQPLKPLLLQVSRKTLFWSFLHFLFTEYKTYYFFVLCPSQFQINILKTFYINKIMTKQMKMNKKQTNN